MSRAAHRAIATVSATKGWLLVGTLAAAGATMTGTGVFASWVATSSATSGAASAASLGVTYTDTNGTTFSTAVTNLLPGDFLYRYADLVNSGSVSQTFSAGVTGSGAIAAAGGLQIQVDKCSVSWSGGSCSGTTTPLATATDVASAGSVSLGTVAAAASVHLRYKFILNASAVQATFQGTTGTVTVQISGSSAVSGGQDRTAG